MTRTFWNWATRGLPALCCGIVFGTQAGAGDQGSPHAACECPAGIELAAPAWVRLLPPGLPNAAAYMTLRNLTGSDLHIVAAESSAARATELHDHLLDRSGVMRMREVEAIVVPANGEVELKPGGLHLMLIGLVEPLHEGQLVPMILHVRELGRLRIPAVVQRPDPGAGGHHGDHSHPHGQ